MHTIIERLFGGRLFGRRCAVCSKHYRHPAFAVPNPVGDGTLVICSIKCANVALDRLNRHESNRWLG